ncbi:uncharacterized protein LOC128549136 [Mercenaria mercenaria]|uniref:uncharacterized protein LOC128549136 n=1 Tax=Mercenaria mercenaria TaxID=6596 RepID=UPI00234F252D|nr:uncharacterized protein LOC128549136 [Mercenaria mercenaria]XP_053381449.1 uncharacterized protein LOC128549136 [Mercenaria mercenaria]XP_053381450.1 uncharacterized protein LOC128549136 [Mercenaria mercenaria]
MASGDNEKYLRIVLLLTKGGTLVIREVFARELTSYISQHGGNLDTLLQNYESNIKKRKYLSRPQCLKLFPPTGKTNFQQWDIGLLVFVTLHVFGTSLSPSEKLEIRQIQILRNDLSHTSNAELDSSSYQDYLLLLENAISSLTSGLGNKYILTQTKHLFNDCKHGPLDVKSTLEQLHEIKEKEELFQEVLDNFKKIEEESKKNTETIVSTVHEVGAELKDDISRNTHMLAELQKKLETFIQKDGICTKIIQIIGTKICVEGIDEEVTNLIEEIVIDVINKAKKKTFGSKDIRAIKEAVKQILQDMKCDGDNDILYAKQSCVFIWVRCNTYKGLRGILEYIESPRIAQRLDKLSEAVMTSLNISCKFSCSIVPSSLRSLRARLYAEEDGENDSPVKYKSSIIVPIRCKTVHGLSRIWEMVEGGETQKFEDFSQTISNVVGSQVTVTASIDLHEFSEAVQKIDTFESEVNELFTNLRNIKSMMTLATTLSADSGVPTSWGHHREELGSYEAGDSFTYGSDVSYILDKRSKTTFTDEPDIWSESMLTDIDSRYSQSEEYTHPIGQQTLQGINLRIPPLLLPKVPLPFFHCVKKTPKHTDLSFHLCEALNEMEIDMLRKTRSKVLSMAEFTNSIHVVFKSNAFPRESINTELLEVALDFQSGISKDINEIEATGYIIKPEFAGNSFIGKYNRVGPSLIYVNYLEFLQSIEWPAYAQERLLQRNGSFSRETKLHLMQHKCTLEQVQSEYSPFLWRFTSKLQERYLIEHLNDLQWNCLFAMRNLLNENTVFTDEAFCMSLFYTMERLPTKMWNERENYLSCLMECLCTLLQFVENSFVSNFFWPTNNILLETISAEERKRMVAKITDMVENPFETFFRLPWAEVQNEVRTSLRMLHYIEKDLRGIQHSD